MRCRDVPRTIGYLSCGQGSEKAITKLGHYVVCFYMEQILAVSNPGFDLESKDTWDKVFEAADPVTDGFWENRHSVFFSSSPLQVYFPCHFEISFLDGKRTGFH